MTTRVQRENSSKLLVRSCGPVRSLSTKFMALELPVTRTEEHGEAGAVVYDHATMQAGSDCAFDTETKHNRGVMLSPKLEEAETRSGAEAFSPPLSTTSNASVLTTESRLESEARDAFPIEDSLLELASVRRHLDSGTPDAIMGQESSYLSTYGGGNAPPGGGVVPKAQAPERDSPLAGAPKADGYN